MRQAWQCVILLLGFFVAGSSLAQDQEVTRYVAEIELQTEEDLGELLGRAESMFVSGEIEQRDGVTLVLVLHGPVLRSLLRENYLDSKPLVDQAASLSALGLLEFQACRSWMGENGVDEAGLQPFVETVAWGAAEVQRLVREEGYLYF